MKSVEWTKNVKKKEYIYIKTLVELLDDYGVFSNVPLSWTIGMDNLAGKRIYVNKQIYENLHSCESDRDYIFSCDGYNISAGMLKPRKQRNKSATIIKNNSLIIKNKKEDVINKMISKVDKDRIRTLFEIGARLNKKITISEKELDNYLLKWANAKYEMYILFGNKLKIEEHIEEELNFDIFKEMYEALKRDFPKYSFVLDYIDTFDALKNKFTDSSNTRYIKKYCKDIFNEGMKVTKFLSKLYEDDKFDIALSKMLQNRKVDTMVTISIDPYDYLTMSLTKYSWLSCFDISSGCYSNAPFSALIDEVLMVCYTSDGKDYDFNYKGKKYSGNNKKDRWFLYLDKTNCNFLLGGKMGSPSSSVIELTEKIFKKCVLEKFPSIEWDGSDNSIFVKRPKIDYHHFQDGIFKRFSTGECTPIAMNTNLTCPICGKESNRIGLACSECKKKYS